MTSHDPSTRPVPRPRVHATEEKAPRSTRVESLDRSSRSRSIESVSIESSRYRSSRVGTDRVESVPIDASRDGCGKETETHGCGKENPTSHNPRNHPPHHHHPPPPAIESMAACATTSTSAVSRAFVFRERERRHTHTRVTETHARFTHAQTVHHGRCDRRRCDERVEIIRGKHPLEHHGGGSSRSLRRLRGRSRRGHSHGASGSKPWVRDRGVCHGGRRARGGESHGRYVGFRIDRGSRSRIERE